MWDAAATQTSFSLNKDGGSLGLFGLNLGFLFSLALVLLVDSELADLSEYLGA